MAVYVISDTHFGHSATFESFKNQDGTPMRPFTSLDEMHDTMIYNWNSVVTGSDIVLHLGDVAFSGQHYDSVMPRLNGTKYLIRGNHDTFSEGRYQRHFKRILGCYVRDNFAFTHVPVHVDSVTRWRGNIHGHLHTGKIDDPKYFCACVEQINYTPIDFEEIKRRIL